MRVPLQDPCVDLAYMPIAVDYRKRRLGNKTEVWPIHAEQNKMLLMSPSEQCQASCGQEGCAILAFQWLRGAGSGTPGIRGRGTDIPDDPSATAKTLPKSTEPTSVRLSKRSSASFPHASLHRADLLQKPQLLRDDASALGFSRLASGDHSLDPASANTTLRKNSFVTKAD